MRICNYCKKRFEEKHFNQQCCSEECKINARKRTRKKYKQSQKGRESNKKWIQSDRRKFNEKKYMQKPKAKKLSVIRIKRYYERHPEQYIKHLIRKKERQRWLTEEYRIMNKESAKRYRKTPKGRQSNKNGKARRRQLERTGNLTLNEWKEILKKHNYCCAICGTKEKIEQDHIMPLSKGGKHEKENIQPLCRSCNASKGNKIGRR